MQDQFDVPVNLLQFSPEKLLGLTFLCNVGDGEHVRAKIVKKILDKDTKNPKQIKMLISYGNDCVKELFAYNMQLRRRPERAPAKDKHPSGCMLPEPHSLFGLEFGK